MYHSSSHDQVYKDHEDTENILNEVFGNQTHVGFSSHLSSQMPPIVECK